VSHQEEQKNDGLKMNIMVISPNEKMSKEQKSKIFDMRFARLDSIYPALKNFQKDVHAIVAFSKKEEHISSMSELID
jgi:hypothetical protein